MHKIVSQYTRSLRDIRQWIMINFIHVIYDCNISSISSLDANDLKFRWSQRSNVRWTLGGGKVCSIELTWENSNKILVCENDTEKGRHKTTSRLTPSSHVNLLFKLTYSIASFSCKLDERFAGDRTVAGHSVGNCSQRRPIGVAGRDW